MVCHSPLARWNQQFNSRLQQSQIVQRTHLVPVVLSQLPSRWRGLRRGSVSGAHLVDMVSTNIQVCRGLLWDGKWDPFVMNLVHALPLTHHLRSLIHHTDSYTTLLSLFTIELHFPSSIAPTTRSWHQSHITLIALLITQSHTLYKPGTSTQIRPSIVCLATLQSFPCFPS